MGLALMARAIKAHHQLATGGVLVQPEIGEGRLEQAIFFDRLRRRPCAGPGAAGGSVLAALMTMGAAAPRAARWVSHLGGQFPPPPAGPRPLASAWFAALHPG